MQQSRLYAPSAVSSSSEAETPTAGLRSEGSRRTEYRRFYMYYVYILTNQTDKVMYIGVTNDLKRRLYEHKNELVDGFTKRYHVHKLVYYEMHKEVTDAIAREKKLKSLLRIKKNALVESMNPSWVDLSEKLFPNTFVQCVARDPSLRSPAVGVSASLKDDTSGVGRGGDR